MGYSKFRKIQDVVERFNLDMRLQRLFQEIEPVSPSEWLLETLSVSELLPLTNEKSKAERVISPILTEVAKVYTEKVSFFSGEQINVKPEDDLSGECDFFFALQPPKLYIDAPIISLTEAKDEDMDWGIAQCAAQMLGAKYFNDARNKSIPIIFGCVTTGTDWQFLKFENDVYYVDTKIYTDLKEILGVWHHVINLYL
ncbi:MAG: hypothetical protein LH614_04960 [Pyrinomonadaceae bacterium]|nr:hypothetical protein [Pyrinomonadaceae bacterium]